MSSEVLYRNDQSLNPVHRSDEFDGSQYTLAYQHDVPPSLEIDQHPTSEFDRHQHLFHIAALDKLYARIDEADPLLYKDTKGMQEWKGKQYKAISDLHALRSIYELRQGRDQEAVFFAGRTHEFTDKLRIFEAAYEAGNLPVLVRLGDLRSQAHSEGSLKQAVLYMMSEVTVGLNVESNLRDIPILLYDKNIDDAFSLRSEFEKRKRYSIWKATERHDDDSFHLLIAGAKPSQITEATALKDAYMAAEIQTIHKNGMLLSPDQTRIKSQLITRYYSSDFISDHKNSLLHGSLRYVKSDPGLARHTAQSILGLLEFKKFANITSNSGYKKILDHFLIGIGGWDAKAIGPSMVDFNDEVIYRQNIESLGRDCKIKDLVELMHDAQTLALATTEDNTKAYERYAQLSGQIEAVRLNRNIRSNEPFVDIVDQSKFRTDYNRQIAKLADQAAGVGDIVVRLNVLFELLDLQATHDTSVDSTYEDQLSCVSKLAQMIVGNPAGLYGLETSTIVDRCGALGVQI